jgi:HSP20 family molecular chaperone IbpA
MDGFTASLLGDFISGGAERWSHQGATASVTVELPGVDPQTVRVSRIAHTTVVCRWTDRMGSGQTRRWTPARFTDVRAVLKNGLLTITIDLQPEPPPAPPEKEIPVQVDVL